MPEATATFTVPAIEHATYIRVPPSKVYETLSTGAGWDAWFTRGTTVDPRPGGEIRLRWNNFGAGRWTTEDGGPVVEAIPDKRFAFQWSPGGCRTTVDIELKERDGGTLVELRETGYRPTSESLTDLAGCAVGWGEALALLKFYLEHNVTYGEVPA